MCAVLQKKLATWWSLDVRVDGPRLRFSSFGDTTKNRLWSSSDDRILCDCWKPAAQIA